MADWLALGCVVAVVYMATPGGSNNPRVLIPALPAFCILVADGLMRMRPFPRKLALSYILAMFMLVNAAGHYYQLLQASVTNAMVPVCEALRDAPRGFVLTDAYWDAAL